MVLYPSQARSFAIVGCLAILCLGQRTDASLVRSKPEWASPLSPVGMWCAELREQFRQLHWRNLDPCQDLNWKSAGVSVRGRPLVYGEFGDLTARNTTVIFSAVHGDEVTPVYLGFQLARWMLAHPQAMVGKVILAPLVNPDGFLDLPRRRVNANGVDLNRNFATADWDVKALAHWKQKYRSDPRRFPGVRPRSEPETVFQEDLIARFKPRKILSIHSPLNFLDYDGPNSRPFLLLRSKLRAVSGGFYPGSLGNFAGRDLQVPTLTLELPTARAMDAERHWRRFEKSIREVIAFSARDGA